MDEGDEMALLREVADAVEARLREAPPSRYGEASGSGADGSATKWVDAIAEEVVLETVREADAPWDVLSEEAGYVDRGADRTLVVDPVDGTTNAAHGIPFYAVSLAVGRDRLSDVDVALVRNLATGQTYEAREGGGARLDGEPLETAAFDLERAMYSSSPSHGSRPEALTEALERGEIRGVRRLGSAALEMCLVAQGALDAYHHPGGALRVIDVAASSLVLREAGGLVRTPGGEPLEMGFDLAERAAVLAVGDREALRYVEVLT